MPRFLVLGKHRTSEVWEIAVAGNHTPVSFAGVWRFFVLTYIPVVLFRNPGENGGGGIPAMLPELQEIPPRTPTTLEALVFAVVGVLVAWAILLVGASSGYALAKAISHWFELPLTPLSLTRLTSRGPLGVVGLYAMAGYLIEILRLQAPPLEGWYYRAWTASSRLRRMLFVSLGLAAVVIGLFAGLFW